MMNDRLIIRLEPITLSQPLPAYAATIDLQPITTNDSPTKYWFTLKEPIAEVQIIQLRQLLPVESVYHVEKRLTQKNSLSTALVEYDTDVMEYHIDEAMIWLGNPCVFGCFIGEQGLVWGYLFSTNAEVDAYRYMKTVYEFCETEPILLIPQMAYDYEKAKQRFKDVLHEVNKVAI